MKYYVTTPPEAQDICTRIAIALGYPRQGRLVDGTPTNEGATLLYVEPRMHPTDPNRSAVPIDGVVSSVSDPKVAIAVSGAVELDESWVPSGQDQ